MSARLNDPSLLIGHWTLQGHLEDVSGYGHHMTWEGFGFGEGYQDNLFGIQAALLGGGPSGDYLRHAIANWRSGDTKGTITGWIMRSAVTGFPTIFASSDESTNTRFLLFHLRTAGQLSIERVNASGTDRVRGTTVLALNKWYHVAVVSNGTSWQLYLDGVAETLVLEAGVNSGDWFADIPDRDNITIGNLLHFAPVIHFEGGLGGVRVYNVGLTADEIKKLFLATVPRLLLSEQPIPQLPNLLDGPVGAWLNKSVVGSARDSSPNGNDGTIVGAPVQEKVGMSFDGTNDYIDLGDIAELDFGLGDFTILAWALIAPGQGGLSFFLWDQRPDGSNGLVLFRDGGSGKINGRVGTANILSDGLINDAIGWFNVVLMRESGVGKLFINAVQQAGTPDWSALSITASATSRIGARSFTSPILKWEGELREVEAYPRAMPIRWIKHRVRRGVPEANLVLHIGGTCDKDLSRYRRPLTITDAIVGRHIDTDSADANALVATADEVAELSGAVKVSVSFWSYLRTDAANDRLFAKYLSTVNSFEFKLQGGGAYQFDVEDGTGAAGWTAASAVVLNRWQHFLLTYDGDGVADADKMKIFINGVSYTLTFSGALPSALYTGTEVFGLNGIPGNPGFSRDGLLDDFKLFVGEVKSVEWARNEYLSKRSFY